MKISYNLKSMLLLVLFVTLILLASYSAKAQISNSGDLYISNNSSVYLKGDFKFGTIGTTSSARTTVIGTLSFAPTATSSNAGVRFMDGYVRKYGTGNFVYPIGQSTIYAPISINPLTADTNGVVAAYYSSAPAVTTFDVASVSKISTSEYWDIKGTALSNISLTWRESSAISILTTAAITDLIIIGFNDLNTWVQIPSVVDATSILGNTSDLNSGSITSIGNVDLSKYSSFSLGAKGGCALEVASSGITKTWNLLGWVGADSLPTTLPSLADKAVINSAFTGNLSCNSLELNADITLLDGQIVEIVDRVSGLGKIIMSSQASVVQRSNTAETPNIVLTKTTRLMKMFDYIYWGTPISENFVTQIAGARALTATQSGAFDLKFKYQTGSGGGWKPLIATEKGRGFITRIKQQAPFVNAEARDVINFTFTGSANNGDITVLNMRNVGGTYDHELLANPYPGSIDLAKFTAANPNLGGSIYLWTAGTAVVSNYTGTYTNSDYSIWNKSGETQANLIPQLVDGKIASGQSFRVQVLDDDTTATFNNCMRLTTGNTNFFRTGVAPVAIDRFKLNMTGSNGVFSQTLIAYIQGATYGLDRDYDAVSNSVSTAKIYSLLGTTKLTINGRNPYSATDVVPLGVSKATTATENFTISLAQQEGIFATRVATIYLHDILLGTYHDFVNGNYTFIANALTSNDRFEVVYTNPNTALNNSDFSVGQVIATINTNTLTIVTSNEMESVDIFDLTGRKVLTIQTVNANNLARSFNYSEGIYIAKIKLANGVLVTQKLINKK